MHNSKPARTNKEAKTSKIIRIEQEQLNKHLDKVVSGTAERRLNELLDAEADRLCCAELTDMSEPRPPKTPAQDTILQFIDQGRQGQTQGSQADIDL